jgi:hypothetical protein
MIPYVEEYKIANMRFGIEDYKQKRKGHFMPDLPHKRYHCWVNGGGIGQADTLQEARQIIFQLAIDNLDANIYKLTEDLFIRLQAKHLLADNMDNLQGFKTDQSKTKEQLRKELLNATGPFSDLMHKIAND